MRKNNDVIVAHNITLYRVYEIDQTHNFYYTGTHPLNIDYY